MARAYGTIEILSRNNCSILKSFRDVTSNPMCPSTNLKAFFLKGFMAREGCTQYAKLFQSLKQWDFNIPFGCPEKVPQYAKSMKEFILDNRPMVEGKSIMSLKVQLGDKFQGGNERMLIRYPDRARDSGCDGV
nr:hypothetical protein Itr_chr12CG19060 [Ipomoea trifida]